jgi:hypothetical protein
MSAILLIGAVSACQDQITNSTGDEGDGIQANVSGSPGDVAEIHEIVETFDHAWTTGDPVTYAAQYHGADWVGPDGTNLSNPAALTGLYTIIIDVVLPGTTRQSTIRRLTFLSGTLAVIDIDTQVSGFEVAPPGVVEWAPGIIKVREKNILQKRGGEWRIIQHQQTVMAPGVQ